MTDEDDQGELFDERLIRHRDGPETESGYESVDLGVRRDIVRQLLQRPMGLTGYELEDFGPRHAWQPRITEWKNVGHAYDTGKRRISPRSNCPNIVWGWREVPDDWARPAASCANCEAKDAHIAKLEHHLYHDHGCHHD